MRKLQQLMIHLWNDESGQGATEYILLLVVVVAVVLAFKGQILAKVNQLMQTLSGQMDQVTQGGGP